MAAFAPRDPASIGVAVVGAGRMAQTHLRNLATIANARVVVVADPVASAAERGRDIARAARATTDPADAIEDPDVEAVVIASSTDTHARLIDASLAAGGGVGGGEPHGADPRGAG